MATRGGNRQTQPYTEEALNALFWAQVDTSGECWQWTGAKFPSGYGVVTRRGRSYRAHRVSFEMEFGPIPEGAVICHTCDVRSCVRPQHLFAGTQQDNEDDKKAKGRQAKGETNGNSRLTAADVIDIRSRYGPGTSLKMLAEEYGVDVRTVHRVVRRETWGHV